MTHRDDESWARYWASGSLTSCADAFSGNYEGAIRAAWEARCKDLRDGARVLDLCTGNGAIALIAAEVAQREGKTLQIDAIDRAAIFPERAVSDAQRPLLAQVRFQSGIDAADLPFADASVDLVTGQFALEYTDVAATAAELSRVIRPGGCASFILHHADSVILRTAAEERRHIELIVDETRIFDRARELFEIVGAVAPAARGALGADPAAQRARLAVNEAGTALSRAIASARHPEILRTANGYLEAAWRAIDNEGLPASLARLAAAREEIAANAARLDDLIGAALDSEQLGVVADRFAANQFSVERGELIDDQQRLIGWMIDATRA